MENEKRKHVRQAIINGLFFGIVITLIIAFITTCNE